MLLLRRLKKKQNTITARDPIFLINLNISTVKNMCYRHCKSLRLQNNNHNRYVYIFYDDISLYWLKNCRLMSVHLVYRIWWKTLTTYSFLVSHVKFVRLSFLFIIWQLTFTIDISWSIRAKVCTDVGRKRLNTTIHHTTPQHSSVFPPFTVHCLWIDWLVIWIRRPSNNTYWIRTK